MHYRFTVRTSLVTIVVVALMSGCSSTDSYSLVSKHPKALSGDVIPALMRTAKARCGAEGGTIQFHEFSQTEYDDRNMRTSLLYSCLNPKKELAVNDTEKAKLAEDTSPVRDLARGRSFESQEYEDTVARLTTRGETPVEEAKPVQAHPDPVVPVSAEWPVYSDQDGEGAGEVPTSDQIAFLTQEPNLHEQEMVSNSKHHLAQKSKLSLKNRADSVAKNENKLSKNAIVEEKRQVLISESQNTVKISKPVAKVESSPKPNTFEADVDALKAKARSLHKERFSRPLQRATPKPIEQKPVAVAPKQIEVKPVSIKAKPVEKVTAKKEEKLESAGYVGRPIIEEVW